MDALHIAMSKTFALFNYFEELLEDFIIVDMMLIEARHMLKS